MARPGLDQALSHLREGDVLVIWKLDRLGRTIRGLIETKAKPKAVVSREPPSIPIRQTRHSSLRLGNRATRAKIASSSSSILAKSVRA
jgi:hypothetical protein